MLLSAAIARAQNYAVVSCNSGSDTTITGVVYDPAGKNPLPNVLVYVPQGAVSAFTDGVNASSPVKDSYSALISGNPLVSVTTGPNGGFSLSGVPAGTGVPLVLQAGRWRRQFVISNVAACATTPLYSTAVTTVGTDPSNLNTSNVTQGGSSSLSGYGEYTSLRFARTQNEGDIPHIALVTGAADALECTLRKTGLADSEFTDPDVGINSTSSNTGVSSSSPAGRVSLFQRDSGGGAKAPSYTGSTTAATSLHTGYNLFGSTSLLNDYNVLMLPCAGMADPTLETGGTNVGYAQNVANFTSGGGRIFSTHFSSDLLNSESAVSGAANWVTPVTPSNTSTGTAIINSSSTDSNIMGEWLYGLNGGTEYSVAVSALRISQTGTNAPTVNWATLSSPLVYSNSVTVNQPVVEFSYYTPFTASSTAGQYGRVFFTDYHVNNSSGAGNGVFPTECTSTMANTAVMSTQEQMLEYSLFQLMNFAVPQFVPAISVTAATSPTTLQAGDTGDNLTLTITNNSTTQPVTLDAPVTVTVTLPAGITATGATGSDWTCATSGSSVSCTLNSQLATGASNTVALTVNVPSSVGSGTNPMPVSLNSQEFTTNPSYSLTINTAAQIATTTTLSAQSAINYGSSATLTATVAGASGTPSGTVSFYDGSTLLGSSTLSSGTATLVALGLIPGSHTVTATYNASSPYVTSTSSPSGLTVNAASTITTLTPASTTVTTGSPVTLTATVTSAYGTPSGTVTFSEGNTVLGAGTLNNGQASFSTSSLAVGLHNIVATYAAQASWAASTSAASAVTVNAAATTTTLSPASTTLTVGIPVTLTATVGSAYSTPSGTVTFSDGTAVLGTATLNNGQASYTASSLAVGSHTITATYAAQTSWAASTSAVAAVTVNSAATATTLTPAITTTTAGSPVTLTATVTSAYGTPSGTVTFSDGSTALGTGTLNNGHASFTTASLVVGSHSITASYAAQTSWAASSSAPSLVTVNAAATTVTLSPVSTTVTAGSPVTLTATVASGYGTPSGTVTFSEGSTVLGTGTLNSGQASFTTSALGTGVHTITASYAAQASWAASTSAGSTVTVTAASTTTTLTPASTTITAGSPMTLTAAVASAYGTPSGTVTFSEGSTTLGTAILNNGQASLTTSTLAVGSHNVTATYAAQASWAASNSAPSAITVTSAPTTTTVSTVASTFTSGSPVALTATVTSADGTPSGTVTFSDGATVLGTGTLVGGQASLTTSALAVGSHTITVTYAPQTPWATSTSSPLNITVTNAPTTTTLSASASSAMIGSLVTFTAQVASASGAPTGTITFLDGSTALGTSVLSNGAATLTTSALAAGTHTITAVYGGLNQYVGSSSPAQTVSVIDLNMGVSGTDGGGSGSTPSSSITVTAETGASASVQVDLSSGQNTAMPVNSTLTVTGQPAGTTITLTGNNWQPTSPSSWVYPVGYTLTSPTLTFKLPTQLAANDRSGMNGHPGSKAILLSLLLLPFLRRGRSLGKRLALLALLALSLGGTFGLSGCAANNGFYAEKSYRVTVTLTAGTVSKVSYVTLNVN